MQRSGLALSGAASVGLACPFPPRRDPPLGLWARWSPHSYGASTHTSDPHLCALMTVGMCARHQPPLEIKPQSGQPVTAGKPDWFGVLAPDCVGGLGFISNQTIRIFPCATCSSNFDTGIENTPFVESVTVVIQRFNLHLHFSTSAKYV